MVSKIVPLFEVVDYCFHIRLVVTKWKEIQFCILQEFTETLKMVIKYFQRRVVNVQNQKGDFKMSGKDTDLYMTIPFGRTWHIFGKDDRSLCGKAMMWSKDKSQCEDVKGTEVYSKGQDCKVCFKKAGLKLE